MATNYQNDVITKVVHKNAGEYGENVTYNVGAEQRYIGGLLNSHVNNLEEQSILGVDCITAEWTDLFGVSYITKKFYDGTSNISKGYYILFSIDYSKSGLSSHDPVSFESIVGEDGESKIPILMVNANLTGKTGEYAEYGPTFDESGKPDYSSDADCLILALNNSGDRPTASYNELNNKGTLEFFIDNSINYNIGGSQKDVIGIVYLDKTNDDGIILEQNVPNLYFDGTLLGAYFGRDALVIQNPGELLEFEDDKILIDPGYQVVKEEILAFRPNANETSDTFVEGTDIKIAEKITSQKYDKKKVKRTQSIITNYLK